MSVDAVTPNANETKDNVKFPQTSGCLRFTVHMSRRENNEICVIYSSCLSVRRAAQYSLHGLNCMWIKSQVSYCGCWCPEKRRTLIHKTTTASNNRKGEIKIKSEEKRLIGFHCRVQALMQMKNKHKTQRNNSLQNSSHLQEIFPSKGISETQKHVMPTTRLPTAFTH